MTNNKIKTNYFFTALLVYILTLLPSCLQTPLTKTYTTNAFSDSEINADFSESDYGVIIDEVAFMNGNEITVDQYQQKQLFLKTTLNNTQSYYGITSELKTPHSEVNDFVVWYSNDPKVAGITNTGKIIARTPGSTTVMATIKNKSQIITVHVQAKQTINQEEDSQTNTPNDVPAPEITTEPDNTTEQDEQTETDNTNNNTPDELTSINITINDTLYETGDYILLLCSLDFKLANSKNNVSELFYLDGTPHYITWTSSNESVVSIHNGYASFIGHGETTITAQFEDISDSISISVKVLPEEPSDDSDSFLNNNDIITETLGDYSGFGNNDFPSILYGPPSNTYDVLSLGEQGSILIELNDYIIVDGIGPDFTIFENPFTGWEECATVSVSNNGNTFYTFDCDQYDDDNSGNYEGCAGKTPVNYGLSESDYLNPNLSGGDVFDLDDLDEPLAQVKYIKITDIGLCGETTSVPATNSAGFDFDAMSIINGVNE